MNKFRKDVFGIACIIFINLFLSVVDECNAEEKKRLSPTGTVIKQDLPLQSLANGSLKIRPSLLWREQDYGSSIVSFLTPLLFSDKAPIIKEQTLFVNPTDSMLYDFSLDNGEKYIYFGQRDASGNVTDISFLAYTDEAGEKYSIFFDQNGLPAQIIDEQGVSVKLEFNFTDSQDVDDDIKSSVQDETMSASTITVLVSKPGAPEVQLTLFLEEPLIVGIQDVAVVRAKEATGNVKVKISSCGDPVTPKGEVWVDVWSGVGQQYRNRYPAIETNEQGVFVGSIPQRQPHAATPGDIENMCSSFADKLSTMCRVVGPILANPRDDYLTNSAKRVAICTALGEGFASASVLAGPVTGGASLSALPATPYVTGGCTALLTAGTAICGTLGFSTSAAFEEENIAQKICAVRENIKFIDSVIGLDTVTIQALSAAKPGGDWGRKSEEMNASATGPFPELVVSSSEPYIEMLSTVPVSVNAGEDYEVTSFQYCADSADLTVTRDHDDLSNDFDYKKVNNQSVLGTLRVPGTPMGKADHIEASATNSSTGKTDRKEKIIYYSSPTVTVVASDMEAAENPTDNGAFTLTRKNASRKDPLSIRYTLTGSAVLNDDFLPFVQGFFAHNEAVIPADASSVTVTIVPQNDDLVEGVETVNLTIDTKYDYEIGGANSATVSILDDDKEDSGNNGQGCLDYFSYMVTAGNGIISLSGDPDYPTITWSRNDGAEADELYIESEDSTYPFHIIGDIPHEVTAGTFGYPGTEPGIFCDDSCRAGEPIERGESYEIWINSSNPYDDLRLRFQIWGVKDDCN